jgi:hypothetical protein
VPTEICVNINSNDADLMAAIEGPLPKSSIHSDDKDSIYYRHKYGLEGIWGRNFNFGIKNPTTDEFDDIGNVIIIESKDGPLGVELALGDTTIMRQMYGLAHIQDIYGIELTLERPNDALRRKTEDAMITCLALFREGLRPGTLNTQARILRSYVKALSLYRQLSGMSLRELGDALAAAEKDKLPFAGRNSWQDIIDWIDGYEASLEDGPTSAEDIKVFEALAQSDRTDMEGGGHH